MKINKPTLYEVNKYQEKWGTDQKLSRYPINQAALDLLYKQDMYRNDKLENVLLKVSVLNDFYSTYIRDTYTVAKHIFNIRQLDRRLAEGDVYLIDEIKKIKMGNRIINFYSFATKFCSNHNPEAFPIYDKFVGAMLVYFNNQYHFSDFSYKDLKEYIKFKSIIAEFQQYFHLENCSFVEIDRYLWLLGKDIKDKGIIKI